MGRIDKAKVFCAMQAAHQRQAADTNLEAQKVSGIERFMPATSQPGDERNGSEGKHPN